MICENKQKKNFNRLTKFNEFNKHMKCMFINKKQTTISQIDCCKMNFFSQLFNFNFVVDSVVVKNNVKRIISCFCLRFLHFFACKNDCELKDLISKKYKFENYCSFFVF